MLLFFSNPLPSSAQVLRKLIGRKTQITNHKHDRKSRNKQANKRRKQKEEAQFTHPSPIARKVEFFAPLQIKPHFSSSIFNFHLLTVFFSCFVVLFNSMDRRLLLSAAVLSLLTLSLFSEVHSATFKIVNKCRSTIWPGLLSGAGTAPLPTTGFALKSGESRTITIPKSWSGRLWGRALCGRDSSGKFSCLTGDCGSGTVQCAGGGAKPPTTLAEFTLNGADGLDFYDVSLVDGYNLPMLVIPKGTKGGCASTGCLVDLNGACPKELSVASGGRVVACRSACEAFGDPRFCCSGAYATPETCGPSLYSLFFKYTCPRSYSYAYDDKTSTYTCASADYIIIFCPLPYTSQKLLGARKDGAQLPLVNKTTMYIASRHANGAAHSGSTTKFGSRLRYRPCCCPGSRIPSSFLPLFVGLLEQRLKFRLVS